MEGTRKGIRLADFCPLCMNRVIPENALADAKKELARGSLERALKTLYRVQGIAKLDILLPRDREIAGALGNTPIIYPICRNCSKQTRSREAKDKIKKSLVQNLHILTYIEDFDFSRWLRKPREGGCVF